MLRGYTIGQGYSFSMQDIGYDPYSIRDDFTYSFARGGRHDLRTGGEHFAPTILCGTARGARA